MASRFEANLAVIVIDIKHCVVANQLAVEN